MVGMVSTNNMEVSYSDHIYKLYSKNHDNYVLSKNRKSADAQY